MQRAEPVRIGTRPRSFSPQPVRYLPATIMRHSRMGETAARRQRYARSNSQDMRESLPEPAVSQPSAVSQLYSLAPWHFLYFLPLPHGHGSLRPTLGPRLWIGSTTVTVGPVPSTCPSG